jgi:excisionase family DNA binding protein
MSSYKNPDVSGMFLGGIFNARSSLTAGDTFTQEQEAAFLNSPTWRARMPHIRRSACGDAGHGDPMVGPGYRRIAKSDGNADRPGQDMDSPPCELGTQGERHSSYRSAEKNGEWLTMSEAAAKLGVSHHRIRRLIKDRILPAQQVVPGAPHQIRSSDLETDAVATAISRTGRPCRTDSENLLPMFPST